MFTSHEGKQVPSVTLRIRRDNDWASVSTEQIFNGRTVVVFSLPGAFTPTCSSTHLPRYNELAETFFANGVDEIVCVSVNDPFVMAKRGVAHEADKVTLIPDGNGAFTEGMGLLVDKSNLGFGKRSWRYSMLVKDGVVVKQFIEPQKAGDPFEVSDADTMLDFINPKAQKPDPSPSSPAKAARSAPRPRLC
jgi:peroxiredoxin